MDEQKVKSLLFSSNLSNQKIGVNLAINVLQWSMFEILTLVMNNMNLHEVIDEYEDNYSETVLNFLNIDIYFEPFLLAEHPHVLICASDYIWNESEEFKFFFEDIPEWHMHEFEVFLVGFFKKNAKY